MSELFPQPALRDLRPVPAAAPGLQVRLLAPPLVSVLARKGATAGLREKAAARFGLDLSEAPARRSTAEVTALGIGPGRWLFLGAPIETLQSAFSGLASLSDHSDGYAVFELWGRDALSVLAKGAPLDMSLFRDDEVAVTAIAHIGAVIWKEDAERHAVAVFRSYAASFWHWLSASAGEFGLSVEQGR
jgi:sarcosine oxidase subunit gamma